MADETLVERLQGHADWISDYPDFIGSSDSMERDLRKAADALAAKDAEISQWRELARNNLAIMDAARSALPFNPKGDSVAKRLDGAILETRAALKGDTNG